MTVELERHGAVALLTLSNPAAHNALSPAMLDALEERLRTIESTAGVRAVVITGAGDRAFCAGADIAHMRAAGVLEARDYARRGHELTARLEALATPVIAAVNGHALGGGCELALACDIRLAAERARFGQPEVNLGILPGWGGTQRLARLTSPGLAKQLIFTGRPIDAARALAVGLVNEVHPDQELLARALEVAADIAAKPAWAIAQAKQLCNLALDGDGAGHLAREVDAFALAFATADQREGMEAFFARRAPRFEGVGNGM